MRDTEVAAVAQHYSQCHGSENGIYLCASMPLGTPSKFANRHLQNRVIQKGDQIALLVEDNGPGGMYTELGRSCVVGAKVPQAMKDELAFCMESRKLHARPAQAGHALQGHLGRLQRLHAQERPARWRRGSIATARATTWSSAR